MYIIQTDLPGDRFRKIEIKIKRIRCPLIKIDSTCCKKKFEATVNMSIMSLAMNLSYHVSRFKARSLYVLLEFRYMEIVYLRTSYTSSQLVPRNLSW